MKTKPKTQTEKDSEKLSRLIKSHVLDEQSFAAVIGKLKLVDFLFLEATVRLARKDYL